MSVKSVSPDTVEVLMIDQAPGDAKHAPLFLGRICEQELARQAGTGDIRT